MLITKNKTLLMPKETDPSRLRVKDVPLTENEVYCIEDGSELAIKAKEYFPDLDFITDQEGKLIDIVQVEHIPSEEELRARYEELVLSKIRLKYSATDENKVVREALATGDYTAFDNYNDYIEQCKAEAKAEVYSDVPNNQSE